MSAFISINDNFLNEVDFEKYSKFSKETNMWGDRIPNSNWSGRVIFTENIEGFSQRNSSVSYTHLTLPTKRIV